MVESTLNITDLDFNRRLFCDFVSFQTISMCIICQATFNILSLFSDVNFRLVLLLCYTRSVGIISMFFVQWWFYWSKVDFDFIGNLYLYIFIYEQYIDKDVELSYQLFYCQMFVLKEHLRGKALIKSSGTIQLFAPLVSVIYRYVMSSTVGVK